MSNKNKGILIFAILYTVLFVFDGVKLLASLMPSVIAKYLSRTTTTDSCFCLCHWTSGRRIIFPSGLIALLAGTVARFTKHYSGRTCFCSDSYAQFGPIRVDWCSWLLRWRPCLFYYLCERKREYLLSPTCSHVKQQPLLNHFSYQYSKMK